MVFLEKVVDATDIFAVVLRGQECFRLCHPHLQIVTLPLIRQRLMMVVEFVMMGGDDGGGDDGDDGGHDGW